MSNFNIEPHQLTVGDVHRHRPSLSLAEHTHRDEIDASTRDRLGSVYGCAGRDPKHGFKIRVICSRHHSMKGPY